MYFPNKFMCAFSSASEEVRRDLCWSSFCLLAELVTVKENFYYI